MRVLVFDIGGSHVKISSTGRKSVVEIPSGPRLSPSKMLAEARRFIANWKYDAVTIGYPGKVKANAIEEDAPNLGSGWVNFDFQKAFKRRVKILNDAAMQALGSYQGGRMLFLGLGTGLGSALILDGVLHATELGDLRYQSGRTYGEYLGKAGLKRIGRRRWSRHVRSTVKEFKAILQVDYVVLGGGQAKRVKDLPAGVIRGNNTKAFVGGTRAWKMPKTWG